MKRKILFVIFYFSLLTSLFSQTGRLDVSSLSSVENSLSLSEIEALIKQTDYNEALRQLYVYIKKNPDDFDRAQVLIKQIMNRRQRYSILTEMAMRSSEENPEDHETPAKIILEMRSIEKNPPEEIRYVIDMLEDLHLFKYYAYLFDSLIEDAAQLAQKEQCAVAAKKLQEGFWIYRDEFEDEWKAYPEITSGVKKVLEDLNRQIQILDDDDLRKKFDDSVAQFNQYIRADNFIAANTALFNLKNYFYSYVGIQNDVMDCAMRLSELYEKQKEIDPQITDASYIPFLIRFITGLPAVADSGINGAILYKLGKATEEMKASVSALITKYYSDFYAVLPSDLFSSGIENLEESMYLRPIQNYVKLGNEIAELYRICMNEDGSLYNPAPEYESNLTQIEGVVKSSFAVLGIASRLVTEDSKQSSLLSQFNGTSDSGDADELAQKIDLLFESVIKMNSITGTKESLALKNQKYYRDSLTSYNDASEAESEHSEAYTTILSFTKTIDLSDSEKMYSRYVEQIFYRSNGASTLAWNVITDYYTRVSNKYITELSSLAENFGAYNEGFVEKIPASVLSEIQDSPESLAKYASSKKNEKISAIMYKYPSLSLKLAEQIESRAEEYLHDLGLAQEKILLNYESNSDWKNVEKIRNKVTSSDLYLNTQKKKVEEFKNLAQPVIAQSQKMINDSILAKNQADSLMENAEAEFKKGNLDSAQKFLQQAGEKYALALSMEQNESISLKSNQMRYELDEKITDAKNTIVVQQSRELYNLARDALNYNRFDDAERYMNSAIAKWAETHTDSNPEFESFKILVNNAVSMESGRELHQSDALYEDMSQLLNIASQYYQEGVQKINSGDTEGGKASFENALSNLDKLKKVYPLNQKAFLLRMNIEKIQNPDKYAAEFKQKIQVAVDKCDNAVTAAEGLSELKGYYEQDPSYPGLKQLIENMEVKLGRRQKKADDSAVAKSNEKMRSAQRIFDSAGPNTERLNEALAAINEALQLNPANRNAEILKDKISTKIGGSTSVVLTSEEQQLLTLAKNEYGSQNIEAAYGYILQLYERNPSCGKIKDVSDTRRRIESRL